MVKSFYWYSKSISNAIEPDWSNVGCEEFEEYRMKIYCPDAPHQNANETKIPSARVPTSTDPVSNFKRGKFRFIVGAIAGHGGNFIPTPSQLLIYQHNEALRSHSKKEYLCKSPTENSCRCLLTALKAFVRKFRTSKANNWSDVKVSDFNTFLVDRGYAPIGGIIVDSILDGRTGLPQQTGSLVSLLRSLLLICRLLGSL